MTTETAEQIKKEVRQAYGQIAARVAGTQAQSSCCEPAQQSSCCGPKETVETTQAQSSCCGPTQQTSCCGPTETVEVANDTATRLYSASETGDLPESVTEASLGCGNPTALASLQPGEVVLDLGSGGGIDCFLAAKKVGPTGRVIGLDMTPEMIKLARRNAKKLGVTNVDFRFGEIEEMPIADASVDVIISNCVINLSPDKDAVFAEAFRVLAPGGRLTVSDIVTNGELPGFIRTNVESWTGCVAGALDEAVYLDKIRAAGLTDVEVTERKYISLAGFLDSEDVQAMLAKIDLPAPVDELKEQLQDKLASITVTAHKR